MSNCGNDMKPQSFSVTIYRRTLARGWEILKCSKNEECIATAKEKYIELRALKLRLWLNKASLIVRRNNSLLIEQRQVDKASSDKQKGRLAKTKSVLVVIQFQDVRQCNLFCDQLCELNCSKVPNKTEKDNDNDGTKFIGMSGSRIGRNSLPRASQSDTVSYIVRLLHDESFLSFVGSIESELSSIPDCRSILESIGGRK